MGTDPASLQERYYAESARRYDDLHDANVEHSRALSVISGFVTATDAASILDVGTGTGRAVRVLHERHPDVEVTGVDPSRELLDVAADRGVPRSLLMIGRGEQLPFEDASFDVVCELGVLHHVADPAAVVREMQRVARHAVFLSDVNRYGQGPIAARLMKLALFKSGLWWPLVRGRNRGRRHQFSEGDGIFYSYSLYDDLDLFADWESVSMIPLEPRSGGFRTMFHPLLTTSHLLLCAVRRVDSGGV